MKTAERMLLEVEQAVRGFARYHKYAHGTDLRRAAKKALQLANRAWREPLSAGIDFLGYVVFPSHTRIRRRVVAHAREKLQAWEHQHVRGRRARATPEEFRHARSLAASYEGHFRHGNSFRLRQQFHHRFPWLTALARSFDHRLEGRRVSIEIAP